ncbi:MAG TPA: hypothetical protein PL033_07285 [Candidatus Brocadiia bacterium]|nr:hypothetical protein [Candidatus Brocadiia bacterium]
MTAIPDTEVKKPTWTGSRLAVIAFTTFAAATVLSRQAGHVDWYTHDRGRDLHVALMTLNGRMPYVDFDWPYGPLMPYYYAGCFKAFGVSMRSFDIGEMAAVGMTALAVAFAGFEIAGAGAAAACGVLFLCIAPIRGYAHTGNHIGVAFFSAVALAFCARYLKGGGRRNIVCAAIFIWLASLVKLNVGIAFAMAMFSGLGIERFRAGGSLLDRVFLRDCGIALAVYCGLTLLVYAPLLHATPAESVPRCFPFDPAYRPDYGNFTGTLMSDWKKLSTRPATAPALIYRLARECWNLQFVTALVAVSAIAAMPRRKDSGREECNFAGICAMWLFAGGAELLLAGSPYGARFFAGPGIAISLTIVMRDIWKRIGLSRSRNRPYESPLQAGWVATAGLLALAHGTTSVCLISGWWEELYHPRGGVSHIRYPQDPTSWATTVQEASDYVAARTRPGEGILAVPMDGVYLFLADRPQATRITDFSRYLHVGEEEQRRIIAELQAKGTRFIIWANEHMEHAGGPEIFGRTHCVILGDWIRENFRPVKRFGETRQLGYGVSYHGVVVLMRGDGEEADPKITWPYWQ